MDVLDPDPVDPYLLDPDPVDPYLLNPDPVRYDPVSTD